MTFKTVVVAGRTYNIKLISDLKADDGDSLDGLITFDDRLIEIRDEVKRSKKMNVLIHEMLHALFHECHLTTHDGWVPDLVEEVLCDAIANMMTENFELRRKR